ncbi:hypothetical protein [Actinomadura atramentaria]|uniref:hypothetical protein n=1 Tax=Actinomadura atramentaria TaxID=1990 RepID=UPI0003663614|nr:hypothetical protein [Actinomadura atramentaria]
MTSTGTTSTTEVWHVVQWSGGIGSWATAQRVAAAHGTDRMILLFADVLVEHPDLYRFSRQAAARLGLGVTRVCDGRTPFELFSDVRFLGNNRIAPCSRILKQLPARRWLEAELPPDRTVLYVGIDSFEKHRAPAIAKGWRPWRVEFPLLQRPHLTKDDMLAWATSLRLRPPALYVPPYNLRHNNCGGFCVRAGIRQWTRMLTVDPDGFAEAEAAEARMRDQLGDVAILRDRRDGRSRPLPLAELRHRTTA